MAGFKRDNYNGGYRIIGLEHDINKARQNRQFQQDMGNIGNDVMNAPADAFGGAVRTTAGMVAGGAAIGVGMARNKRFRYIMQAVLHFPMALILVFTFALTWFASEAGEVTNMIMGRSTLIGLVVGAVWTAAYVMLRTRPKLRRLQYG